MAKSVRTDRSGSPAWSLARLYLRGSLLRVAAAFVAVLITLSTLGALVIAQMTRTPQQFIEQTVGDFDYAVSLPAALAPGDPVRLSALTEALDALSPQTNWGITAPELPLTGAEAGTRTRYQAYAWRDAPLPDRFHLESGSFPVATDEVAAAPATGLRLGDMVALFSGEVRLRVVGIILDDTDHASRTLYGDRAQWAAWAPQAVTTRYPNTVANVELFWNGSDPEAGVASFVSTLALEPGDLAQQVQDRTRLAFARRDVASVLLPIAGVAPLLLVPTIAGLGLGLGLGSWNARIRGQLFRIGVSDRVTLGALLLSCAGAVGFGWAAGSAVGLALSAALRGALASVVSYALAPWEFPWAYLFEALALTAAGASIGVVAGPAARGAARSLGRLERARRPLALAAGLVLVPAIAGAQRGIDLSVIALLVTLIAALLAPDALLAVTRAGHRAGMPRLLAARLVRVQPRLAGGAVACLVAVQSTICLAASISLTQLDVANASLTASTPPGLLKVSSLTPSSPVPPDVVARIESRLPPTEPIVTWGFDQGDINPNLNAPITVVAEEDLPTLLGHTPTAEQLAGLRLGIGLFSPQSDAPTITLVFPFGSVELTSVPIQAPEELLPGALLLASSPLVRDHPELLTYQVLYCPLPQAQIDAIAPHLAADVGIDPGYVRFYAPPRGYELATSTALALAGFAAMAVGVFAGVVAAVTTRCRPYVASLLSLGIGRRWTTQLVGWTVLPMVATAALLSLIAAELGAAAIWWSNPEAFVPWAHPVALAALPILTVVSLVVGGCVGLLRLSVRERHLDG